MALTPNTLSLQRTRLRLYLNEPTAQFWTDALLNMYINEAQFMIACGLIPGTHTGMEEPLLATEAYTATVADQEMYSFAPNYHGVRTFRLRATSTEDFSEMPLIDVEYARAHPRTSVAKPEAYFIWGESGTYQFGLYPACSTANGRIYLTYWRKPTELSADGDALQIPAELHVANALFAAHRAWFERGHSQEAQAAFQLFNTEYQSILPYIRRRLINQDRAVMVGVIGDTDTERTLY